MKTERLKSNELHKLKTIIFKKSGYMLSNTLLEQAFTRKSFSVQNGGENNEILELIGDGILGYFVLKAINEHFGAINSDGKFTIRATEGSLTILKSRIVNNETLANIIDQWQIDDYMLVGKCDEDNQIDKQVKPRADLFEAILGAIAIDSGWNSVMLEIAVERMLSLNDFLQGLKKTQYRPFKVSIDDAVTALKELAEKNECSIPKYEYTGPESVGIDKDGNPMWRCSCSIITEKTGIIRHVRSSSKKDAKKAAAYLVLCDYFEVQNEYGVNGKGIYWTFFNGKIMPETRPIG